MSASASSSLSAIGSLSHLMFQWTAKVAGLEGQHSVIGNSTVFVVDRQNPYNTEVIVKRLPCVDNCDLQRLTDLALYTKSNPHRYICPLLDVYMESDANSGDGLFIYSVYKHYANSLEYEIRSRARRAAFFTERELWTLLQKLLSAYAFLQRKKIALRDIRPATILLDDQNDPKVFDFTCAKEGYDGITVATVRGAPPYMSPKLRQAMLQGANLYSTVVHNVYKSDVFALGMTMLQAACFEMAENSLSKELFERDLMARFQRMTDYSANWIHALCWLLTWDESARPDFLEAEKHIYPAPELQHFPTYTFNDDEALDAAIINDDSPQLQVTAICGYSRLPVSSTQFCDAPCMLTLRTPDSRLSPGTDVVCVVDISYSMKGPRLEMMKESLLAVLDLLTEADRMCLVTFNSQAERRSPLVICNAEGKGRLVSVVSGLMGSGTTNLAAGFYCGMEVLKQRTRANTISMMLLFSDGESNEGPDPLCTSLDILQSSGLADSLEIHTFGIESEINARELIEIANNGRGTFSHAPAGKSLKPCVTSIVSNTATSVVRNVEVNLRTVKGPVEVKIVKVYARNRAQFYSVQELGRNCRRDFLFTIRPEYKNVAQPLTFAPVVADVSYSFGGQVQTTEVPLHTTFVPWEASLAVPNTPVFANWYRVKGADAIQEAKEYADRGDFDRAVRRLLNATEDLGSSGVQESPEVKPVLAELESLMQYTRNSTCWKETAGNARFTSVYYSIYEQR